jgi:hypothetical protein
MDVERADFSRRAHPLAQCVKKTTKCAKTANFIELKSWAAATSNMFAQKNDADDGAHHRQAM